MANLAIAIGDDVLWLAHIRAREEGTSVNALVRAYLESYVGRDDAPAALRRTLRRSRVFTAGSGSSGRSWVRADLHDR